MTSTAAAAGKIISNNNNNLATLYAQLSTTQKVKVLKLLAQCLRLFFFVFFTIMIIILQVLAFLC